METLKDTYGFFLKNQLPVIKPAIAGYDMETGNSFLEFILKILPNTTLNPRGTIPEDLNPKNFMQSLWDKQAVWWAYAESPLNYFIGMSLIMNWIKKADIIKNVLGVGVGPGLYELFIEHTFKDKIESFYCTDISINMIGQVKDNQRRFKAAYRQKSKLKLQVCGIESLPFANESMDIVICNKVLHWSFKKRDAVEEMCRVLKPGGLIMLIVPNGQAGIESENGMIPVNDPIDSVQLSNFLKTLSFDYLDHKEIKFPKPLGQARGAIDDFAVLFRKK